MNPQDPLAELHDIALPDPVSWWPPAPGWWLSGTLVLALLYLAIRYFARRHPADRRAALRAVDQAARDFRLGGDQREFATRISQVLRRLALQRFPREQVAGLSGDRWQDFLLAHAPREIDPRRITQLVQAPFLARQDPLDDSLADTARAWIRANGRAPR